MPVIIKLVGWANDKPLNCAGEYVAHIDVQRAHRSSDWLVPTPHQDQAKRWPDAGAALETWKEVLQSDPVRADGQPNRPFTALTIELEKVAQ